MHTSPDVTDAFLEERRRRGQDKKDELWDGVLHMGPPPTSIHDRFTIDLIIALEAIARRRGRHAWQGGVHEPGAERNYRIPDVSIARPDQVSPRGLEGAELVVEVLSPRDRSRDKFGFYARVGVEEIWLIEPATRELEVFTVSGGDVQVLPTPLGPLRSPLLSVTLERVVTPDGPRLVLVDGDARYSL